MGYIYFGGIKLPSETHFSIQFESKKPSDFKLENERDLDYVEANFINGALLSTMKNGVEDL